MKLGTCVDLDRFDELESKLKLLREMGFTTCQLMNWNPDIRTPENLETTKKLLEQYGVTPSALWVGWTGPCVWNFYEGQTTLGLVPPEYREMRIAQLCDGGDFAKKLGITDVITHMGFIPENPMDPNFAGFCDAVRAVAEHLKANGQNLLFESGQETPVTMLRCFETVGTGNLYVNLDTANVILYGRANPVDALDVFGKYVRNMHAKDGFYPTNGHDLGAEVKIGEGKVNWRALFEKLHELNYDRYVTIEREISGSQQSTDIKDSKAFLSTLINDIYGEGTV